MKKNIEFSKILDPLARSLIQQVFLDPLNGTPNDISKVGCLALAELGKETWNSWRKAFPVSRVGHFSFKNNANFSGVNFTDMPKVETFSGFEFGDGADFSFCSWERWADFFNAKWGDECKFIGTCWGVRGIFSLAKWGDNCNFQGGHWGHDSFFECTHFGSNADFSNTFWQLRIYFNGAKFGNGTKFDLSIWQGTVSFSASGVSGLSNWTMLNPKDNRTELIKNTKPCHRFDGISFKGVKFQGEVYFDNRKFEGSTNFSSIQKKDIKKTKVVKRDERNDVILKYQRHQNKKLVFIDATRTECKTIFSYPPSFHGAELHSDTSFDGVVFPKPTGSKYSARNYRKLKFLLSNQKAVREEQRFFKLEMQEEALSSTGMQKWLYQSYQIFSDFGLSIKKPLISLAFSFLFFTSFYWGVSCVEQCQVSMCVTELSKAIELSLLHSLPLPGINVGSSQLRIDFLPFDNWKGLLVTIFIIIQKIISILFLFFVTLSLRNLFKIR